MAQLGITYTLTLPDTSTVEFSQDSTSFVIESIEGLGASERRSSSEPRPASDGTISYPTRRGARIVTIEGWFYADNDSDLNDMEDELAQALDQLDNANGVLSWTRSGESDPRMITARLIDGYDFKAVEDRPGMRSFLFTLYCADGIIYGPLNTTVEVADGDTENVTPGGTAKTWPIFRLYGPFTYARIKHGSGRTIYLPGLTFGDTGYLEIDTLHQTIRKNGDPSQPRTYALDLVISEFFSLRPGLNTIEALFTGDDAGTKLEVITRPNYASG